MTNARITHTSIGREFGWDYLSDVCLDELESARAAKMRVITNPHQFPRADFPACEQLIRDIDEFMLTHGDLLAEFA